ncbi:hypothetical protein [Kribbella sp. NPDC048915]|uniref:hypothetical protein n=1 Tax=Kribbella sp. NPDC048915 TaxID=3155148 RepID=UPI0033F43E64
MPEMAVSVTRLHSNVASSIRSVARRRHRRVHEHETDRLVLAVEQEGFKRLEETNRIAAAMPATPGWNLKSWDRDAPGTSTFVAPVTARLITATGQVVPVSSSNDDYLLSAPSSARSMHQASPPTEPIVGVDLMTEMMSGVEHAEEPKPEPGLDGLDEQLVEQLVGQARAGGLHLPPLFNPSYTVRLTVPGDVERARRTVVIKPAQRRQSVRSAAQNLEYAPRVP